MNITKAFTLAILLVSCQRHQPLTQNDLALSTPSAFSLSSSSPTSSPSSTLKNKWWHDFKNPLLDEVIEEGLKNNYDLKKAWHRTRAAYVNSQIQKGSSLPQAQLLFNASRQKNTTTPLSSTYSSFSLIPSLSYQLDFFQQLKAQQFQAHHLAKASSYDRQTLFLSLSGAFAKLWFKQLLHQNLHHITKEQIHTLQDLVKLSGNKAASKQLPLSLYWQQKALLQGRQASRVMIEKSYNENQKQLLLLSGKSDFPFAKPSAFTYPLPALPPLPKLYNPKDLLIYRPDVRASYERLLATDQALAEAISHQLPKISIDLSAQFSASKLENIWDSYLLSAGGGLLAPIFQGGSIQGNIAIKKEIRQEALLHFKQVYSQAFQEIENHLQQEQEYHHYHRHLQEQQKSYQAAYNLAKLSYTQGVGDYSSVLDTLNKVQQMELQLVESLAGLLINRVDLYMALGKPLLTP